MAEKANSTDEINKLVEKIEKEKSRMGTSYAYFDGLSTTYQQKEDEWNAERARMAAEIIAEQTNCVKELKAAEKRHQSTIEKMENEHKANVNRMRREFERKLKNPKWIICFYSLLLVHHITYLDYLLFTIVIYL